MDLVYEKEGALWLSSNFEVKEMIGGAYKEAEIEGMLSWSIFRRYCNISIEQRLGRILSEGEKDDLEYDYKKALSKYLDGE